MISLLPAFEHLTFIAIHQTGAVPTVLGLRICAMREPISNGSFAHGNLYGNITCPQSLTMKRQDLFVPLLPLGKSRQSCLLLFPGATGRALWERCRQRILPLPLRLVCSYVLGSTPG